MQASDVVNRALELVARNIQVSGTNPAFDGTAAGNAAGVLYTPAVWLNLRLIEPGFARRTAFLEGSQGTPPPPWTLTFTYPDDCLRLRELLIEGADPNDPAPIRAALYFDQALSKRCIATQVNGSNAYAVYTSNLPTEDQWDQAFLDAVVKRLASPLAMALAGRPDFARELLEEAERAAGAADFADEL